MFKKLSPSLALVAAVLTITGFTTTTSASAATWRGWNTHTQGFPNTVALEHFVKAIAEQTHGKIKGKVYNNAVLGDQTDAIQQLQSGAIQFANFNMSPMGEFVPATNIVSLPYLFKDTTQMHEQMDGALGKKLAAAMAEKGIVALSWFDSETRSFYNTKHPINSPADMKGLKIRVQENDLYVDMVNALGANPTPLPYSDVYQALASGVVEGAENNYPSYKESNHYEVAKYYSEDQHFIIPECLCVAKKVWDKLSAEQQKIVSDAAVDAALEQRKLWAADDKAAKEFVAKHGAIINVPTDMQAFRDAMSPVYTKYFERYPDQKATIEEIRNTK